MQRLYTPPVNRQDVWILFLVLTDTTSDMTDATTGMLKPSGCYVAGNTLFFLDASPISKPLPLVPGEVRLFTHRMLSRSVENRPHRQNWPSTRTDVRASCFRLLEEPAG